MTNTISGSGSISGLGIISATVEPQFAYSVDLSLPILGEIIGSVQTYAYNPGSFVISTINLGSSGTHPYIAANWPLNTEKLITVSGLSGANSGMNGQQFTATTGGFNWSELFMGIDGTSLPNFISTFNLQFQQVANYPGFTINWN